MGIFNGLVGIKVGCCDYPMEIWKLKRTINWLQQTIKVSHGYWRIIEEARSRLILKDDGKQLLRLIKKKASNMHA